MADATGLIGIIRCIEYSAHRSGGREPFFDPDYLPIEIDAEKYKKITYCPVVNHFFDKLLRLRDIALTEPGRRFIEKRHKIIVNFLNTYFDEIDAPQIWKNLLERYW